MVGESNPLASRRPLLAIPLFFALAGVAYQVNQLSAGPAGERNCPAMDGKSSGPDPHPDLQIGSSSAVERLRWQQKGGTVNDFSCLERTPVYGVVDIRSVDDVRNALQFAREKALRVSVAGGRYSMGGQAFFRNNLLLNMKGFNKIEVNADDKTITVESGATWHDIQNRLHPRYAVKAMQSSDIFTVGGSISVNAHGMDHRAGSVGSSIRSMRVMLDDGNIIRVSRETHPELFGMVVGGYGLFGVILDAEIDIVDNHIYRSERQLVKYRDFPHVFENEILPDPEIGLFYGHLSTARGSLLDEMILYKYTRADAGAVEIPPLGEVSGVRLRRFIFNLAKLGAVPMGIKWYLEKHIEPLIETCTVALHGVEPPGEAACLVSRNDPMHDSVPYILGHRQDQTDILHEYFIPRGEFVPFIDGLRRIVEEHDVNLLNASVRVIHPESNFLNYATGEMFAIVLYINQPATPEGSDDMKVVTHELIDLAAKRNGRFFLPYQLFYTADQLEEAYPMIGDFFAAKAKYDPSGLFTNTFYEKYGRQTYGSATAGSMSVPGGPSSVEPVASALRPHGT